MAIRRIGTWNLNNQWSDEHGAFLRDQRCDVWLLTELKPRAVMSMRAAGLFCHCTSDFMARKQHWAAVLSTHPLTKRDDPHSASVAAVVNGITFCSSILPWRGSGQHYSSLWGDKSLAEKMKATIDFLAARLPRANLVWGGDWNQSLEGPIIGSKQGRSLIRLAAESLGLRVATADQVQHRENGYYTIDHIAVPSAWKTKAERIPAGRLSDHDAYVITVHES